MTATDFQFGRDVNNTKFVKFVGGPTKTYHAALSAKPRSFMPKMFATDNEICPVAISKEFLGSRRPQFRENGILYQTCQKLHIVHRKPQRGSTR